MSVQPGNEKFGDFRGASSVECSNVPATVIPGDGAGAQFVDAAVRLLAALGQPEGYAAGLTDMSGKKTPLAGHQ